jgi:hypothetical protein
MVVGKSLTDEQLRAAHKLAVDLVRRAGSYLAEMGRDVARRRTFSDWCGWRPGHDKIG